MEWPPLLTPLLDFVAPPLCIVCREPVSPRPGTPLLCPDCQRTLRQLKIQPPFCRRCGTPLRGWQCPRCHGKTLPFDRARAAYLYTGPVAQLVEAMKYQGFRSLTPWMAREMAAVLPADPQEIQGIVPVPLHPARIRERGFSQTHLLARHLSASTGIPLTPILRRTRYTRSQTTLSPAERRENLKGAFALRTPAHAVREGTWLLVDDVMTSMSTVQEAARVLRRAGARRILVLLFALAPA